MSEIEVVDKVKSRDWQSDGSGGIIADEEQLRDDLCTAAQDGNMEELQRLVEIEGCLVSEPDGFGLYPLHWAAIKDQTAAAEYIIAHGGDVNAVDHHTGQTALHWSVARGAIQVAELLLREGARVDATDEDGRQVAHEVAESGQTDFLYQLVTKWNADPDVLDSHGRSPLHCAAAENQVDCIRLLLSFGAHLGSQDTQGYTPLHWAAFKGHLEASEVLVEAGMKGDSMLTNNDGITPAQLAAEWNHKKVAFFLDENVKQEGTQSNNEDCLQIIKNNNPEKLWKWDPGYQSGNERKKIEVVDEVKSKDQQTEGSMSLFVAVGGGDGGIATNEELFKRKKNLRRAVEHGRMANLKRLVEREGCSVSEPDDSGCYLLQRAAYHNQNAVAQYLIMHGADVNVADRAGQTALHWSAAGGAIQVAEFLLQNKARVDATDIHGFQVAHFGAQYNQADFLCFIVTKWDADDDVLDNGGRSPLHWAAYKGFVDCIRLLLYLGASLARQDKIGCSPLHYAYFHRNFQAVDMLLQAGTKEDEDLIDNYGNTPSQLGAREMLRQFPFLMDESFEETESVGKDHLQIVGNNYVEEHMKMDSSNFGAVYRGWRPAQEWDNASQSGRKSEYDRPRQENKFSFGWQGSSEYRSGRGYGSGEGPKEPSLEHGSVGGCKIECDQSSLQYGFGYGYGNWQRMELDGGKPSFVEGGERNSGGNEKPSYKTQEREGFGWPSYRSGGDEVESHGVEDINIKRERTNFGFPLSSGMGRLQIIKNEELEELQKLGSGTFGTVFHGKWRGTDVAIKRINNTCFAGKPSEKERMRADFLNEAIRLAELHHPNVVTFYGVVLDGPGDSVATVTEYMVHRSLRTALQDDERDLDERKRLLIAMDVAFGMEYLHSKNIVHFDLKSDNLLVNLSIPHKPICKVGDLGLSKVKHHTLISGGVQGTLPWMAPELLNGRSNLVSEKVDVFSFGIVMWELLTGEEPYDDLDDWMIIGGVASNTLRPHVPENCDPDWRSLMERCWSIEASERPSFTEIADQLRAMEAKIPPKG